MSIEVMKQALAKFESLWEIGIDAVYRVELLPEIQALRQAIEQAEKQEPVANRSDCGHKEFMPLCQMCQAMGAQAHSYTAPPRKEWVGLTDEEINKLDYIGTRIDFVRAIEAKLKEKNNG